MPRQKLDLVHASVAQIREIKSEISSLTKMLENDRRSGSPKIQDEAEFKAEIAKKQRLLDDHSPKRLRGENANKLLKQARELEGKIRDEMPKSKEYFQRQPKGEDGNSFDFERAVQQQVAFQTNKVLQKNILAYKNIMRRIDPDDPTLTNIERLRK